MILYCFRRDLFQANTSILRNHSTPCLVLLELLMTTELSVASDLHSGNVHLHSLEHLVGLRIHKDLLLLKSRVLGNEIETALSLLLLKLQGDATHRTSLDSLHEVLRITFRVSNTTVTYPAILFLILLEGRSAHSSTDYEVRNDPGAMVYSLVVLEVQSELLIVLLDNSSSSLLDSSGTHTTLRKRLVHTLLMENMAMSRKRDRLDGCPACMTNRLLEETHTMIKA